MSKMKFGCLAAFAKKFMLFSGRFILRILARGEALGKNSCSTVRSSDVDLSVAAAQPSRMARLLGLFGESKPLLVGQLC